MFSCSHLEPQAVNPPSAMVPEPSAEGNTSLNSVIRRSMMNWMEWQGHWHPAVKKKRVKGWTLFLNIAKHTCSENHCLNQAYIHYQEDSCDLRRTENSKIINPEIYAKGPEMHQAQDSGLE